MFYSLFFHLVLLIMGRNSSTRNLRRRQVYNEKKAKESVKVRFEEEWKRNRKRYGAQKQSRQRAHAAKAKAA